MKIAYLLQMADVSGENGISKKILGQLRAWRAAGHDCRWFCLNPAAHVWPPLADIPHHAPIRGGILRRALSSRTLCREIAAWQPDLIYFRYAYHAPGLPALFRRIPAIAEINSDDVREYPLTLGPARLLYHRLTRAPLLRSLSGFVTVTRELERAMQPFSSTRATIANGIELDTIRSLPSPARNKEIRAIFIGTAGSPWHGLERLAELSELFPDWIVDVVGISPSDWNRQTSRRITPTNIRLLGPLKSQAYAALLPEAQVAIGSLALYKNGMHEACPLKVREYLALGLPVIGACADTDIPDDADYYLRLPNDDTPLAPHRQAIAAFVENWRGRRVARTAVAHIDTMVKETRRLVFMARVLAEWRAARGLPAAAP